MNTPTAAAEVDNVGPWLWKCVAAVVARPVLWPSAVRLMWRHRVNGWWKRPPFVPLPDASWMRFRYETAFASPSGRPNPDEVVAYLRWCRTWQTLQ